eukprot:1137658-Pelagomonas_calceolata.AAC.6
MKELGCFIDGQRQEIDAADCSGLCVAQKSDRERQSMEELLRVSWLPSRGLEESKETRPKFQQCLLKFEANLSKPDLS